MMSIGGARTTNTPSPAPFFLHPSRLMGTPQFLRRRRFAHRRRRGSSTRQGHACIGSLFTTPQYFALDASRNPKSVFRGCPRYMRQEVLDENKGGFHAVVCHGKRNRLQVLVMDNQDDKGPSRWVDFAEFDDLWTLHVDPLSEIQLLDRPTPLCYPISGASLPDPLYKVLSFLLHLLRSAPSALF
ncbi:hypothetical protein BS78_06G076400 [Paspalum vaginatum]|nr:hypothetical protein BS78_06G076400 [Paspalum vaginatum]